MRRFYVAFFLICNFYIAMAQANKQFEVLVYAAPDYYHSACIPSEIGSLEKMAEKYCFSLTWVQEPEVFGDQNLQRFAVIVFLNSNANNFTDQQKSNFITYMKKGGGFVGIHASAATDKKWEWFCRLIGRNFTTHPEIQFAVVNTIDKNFPATMQLPDKWLWSDEWYCFDSEPLTQNQRVLMTVDEKSYDPTKDWGKGTTKGMGDFHPIAWYQEFDGGRSFYSALGHMPGLYNDEQFLNHIAGGIFWAATGKGINK